MATYKKNTKKSQKERIEDNSTTAEVFSTLDKSANRTEAWVAKNQSYILGGVVVVAVVFLGYFGYLKFIKEPTEMEAANEMALAETYFDQALAMTGKEQDSLFTLALNGAEGKYGFVDIIENYSGTDAANLAHYYAGMAYLRMGEYKTAINELDQFQSEDEILAVLAVGGIGNAFVELEQYEDALGYYQQAAEMRSNGFTTPRYLLKSAIIAIELGKTENAKSFLNQIKDNYPDAPEADQVTLYMGEIEGLK